MKKMVAVLLVAAFVVSTLYSGTVRAAACVQPLLSGAVSIAVPTLPSTGVYNIWTRMQALDETHNRYRLTVNGSDCFIVGGSSLTPRTWEWVSFHDGDLSAKVRYTFTNVKNNSLQLSGTDAGVKVDRVLVVKNDCVPVDLGANCQSTAVSGSGLENGSIIVPPLTSGPVSGVIVPTQTIAQNIGTITNVSYFADSIQVPATPNFGFDTSLLSNGTHTISMRITNTNGTVTFETTTIMTQNPESAFTPLSRWVRLHKTQGVLIGVLLGMTILGLVSIYVVRSLQYKKRLMSFRGF